MVSGKSSDAVGGDAGNREWRFFDRPGEGPALIAPRVWCADLAAGVRGRAHVFRKALSQNALTTGLFLLRPLENTSSGDEFDSQRNELKEVGTAYA